MDAGQREIALKALRDAVSLVGSQGAFARKLGVKQQHVSYWLKKNGLPANKAALAEQSVKEAGGHITRQQFCPDVFQSEAPQ